MRSTTAVERDLFYSSYVQTYLQRDVRDLARVGDELAFLRFLRAAAARTGQILNLSGLAGDADVAPNTAKQLAFHLRKRPAPSICWSRITPT